MPRPKPEVEPVKLTLRIPPDLLNAVKARAGARSVNEMIVAAVASSVAATSKAA